MVFNRECFEETRLQLNMDSPLIFIVDPQKEHANACDVVLMSSTMVFLLVSVHKSLRLYARCRDA